MQKIFKTIATAYMISGDMNGYYGKKRNELRKNSLQSRSDINQLENDWYATGADMQKALNAYPKVKELNHGYWYKTV